MGLIKTILIIAFIYYAFKFLARMFGPMLMKKAVDKMQQKASQQFGGGTQQATTVKEGETVIDKKVNNSSKTNDNVGDYVEFEEID